MLAGRENDTASHQRRRVRAMRDIFDRRRDLKVIEVSANENVPRVLGGRPQSDINVDARMQSDTACGDTCGKCGLLHCLLSVASRVPNVDEQALRVQSSSVSLYLSATNHAK